MGMVLEFPADAAMRRHDAAMGTTLPGASATVLILPVIRVERHEDARGEHDGPEMGNASGGGRRPRRG